MQRIQQLMMMMMMIMIMRLWRKYSSRTNTKLTARRRNMKSPKREPLAITLLILHVQQSKVKNQRLQYTTLKKKVRDKFMRVMQRI
eukprot:scaffold1816_cov182-Chaetoceros_neogracile.AAC.2